MRHALPSERAEAAAISIPNSSSRRPHARVVDARRNVDGIQRGEAGLGDVGEPHRFEARPQREVVAAVAGDARLQALFENGAQRLA